MNYPNFNQDYPMVIIRIIRFSTEISILIEQNLQLESCVVRPLNKNSLEYKVRRLLGIGNAEFTTKQRQAFKKWVENNISFEMIKLAYEITVDTTGKASLPYMARIFVFQNKKFNFAKDKC